MKRVLRWSINGLAGLSLLLCVATVGLWVRSCRVRSYRMIDALLYEHGWSEPDARMYSSIGIVSVRRGLMFVKEREGLWQDHSSSPDDAHRWFDGRRIRWTHDFQYLWIDPGSTGPSFRSAGPLFSYEHGWGGTGAWYYGSLSHLWAIGAPHWIVAAALAVLPMLRLGAWLRRAKKAAGLCVTCGYDLRATPERCPECGAVPMGAKP